MDLYKIIRRYRKLISLLNIFFDPANLSSFYLKVYIPFCVHHG